MGVSRAGGGLNYYRRYIGDYGRKTSLLSLIEHGAYCVLLDHYYAEESPLPAEREDIYRLARAVKPEERKAVDKVLARYFVQKPTGFHNERADDELARAAPVIKAAKENGGKGGRPRRENNPAGSDYGGIENPVRNPTYNPAGSEKQGETKPSGIAIRAGDPSSNHHPPASTHQPSILQPPKVKTISDAASAPGRTVETWNAYSDAYQRRYGVQPVRNAKVNGQLAVFVTRLGAEDAPLVARFYLTHNGAFYVRSKHSTNLLLQDAEGLRTEWATGRKVTDTEARNADRTQATGDVFGRLIEEAGHGN